MNPLDPLVFDYVAETGSMSAILKYSSQFDYNVVVKPLKGTGGICVSHARSAKEVEAAVYKAWTRDYGVAISPFVDIFEEIRAVVLLGSVRLMYSKQRISLRGDGSSCLEQLCKAAICESGSNHRHFAKALGSLHPSELERVLPAGEEYPVEWRHNLGLGAKPQSYRNEAAERLAIAASGALNIKFCSVDMVLLKDGSLSILEVNSGVMMDSFLSADAGNRAIAKQIYKDALKHSLELCMRFAEFITIRGTLYLLPYRDNPLCKLT